ncbi:MAG: TrkH family potassium uptake protein [Lachnospiraceae bacterium]|nr:TrkH family potassium uptake protein [Lachnospiraceae bacterium]
MNFGFLRFLTGRLLMVTGALLLLPVVVAAIYREWAPGGVFIAIAACAAGIGALLSWKKPERKEFYAREGFVATSLSWIVMSLVGCLPFIFTGAIPDPIDALFETVSGFTTTGGSILRTVEGEYMYRCVQFWRCFTHWIGGMGVLVFILAILPMADGYGIHLMRAESPGPTASKLVPKLGSTAKILYLIYIFFTVAESILLMITGMPVYDSITITFSTVGTGGFGVRDGGIGIYPVASQVVITVFMILCSINFNAWYLIFIGQGRKVWKVEEIRVYLLMVFGSALCITTNILSQERLSVPLTFHHALFNVASITSTTGFATLDFNTWPEFSRMLLAILTFIGACAGSTGGGFKVSRLIILLKSAANELVFVTHRKSVRRVHVDGKSLDSQTVKSVAAYATLYATVFFVSTILIAVNGFDFTTNVAAVAATLNNVGPGLNVVGPSGNYASFSAFSKLVFIFDMLAGRLELLPLLILFKPATWRRNA